MISVGIIGGAGYTAGELLRILLNHPEAKVAFVHSTSNAGNKISDVHKDLLGETDLVFSDQLDFSGLDVIFLCMGHGKSLEFMKENSLPAHLKVIDLSNDFRLKAEGNSFLYGLPELNREQIRYSKYIANPGCFATGIQLTVLPLAAAGLIVDEIHVNAITGSTGAGQSPSATSHFSWRSGNISAYKIFSHQHLGEINQSIQQLQESYEPSLNFVPIRGNHTRGIFAVTYTKFSGTFEEAQNLYDEYYKDHPFVFLTKENPDLKQVINTNKCILHLEKCGNKLLIISITDNLIKGASGQAVQNMNLMFGLDEKSGLNLKPVAF
ncbi:MAG TPA: N-acetyl-gamma-glutamyl-phosphate reductase [Prolixibacteraceae bacterium]|nr:N-acetyl-gamma-glutamyl-phosphate reductase [Prolixibacteraceae bacterium]HPS13234.1 N-acetyl-gamma-glutamyl-phosphate reductase [Prolixibacteraceae bacterium]